jgi:hypothetical protein
VKTTLEIPDPIFRRAKSVAAQRGIPLRAFLPLLSQDQHFDAVEGLERVGW